MCPDHWVGTDKEKKTQWTGASDTRVGGRYYNKYSPIYPDPYNDPCSTDYIPTIFEHCYVIKNIY